MSRFRLPAVALAVVTLTAVPAAAQQTPIERLLLPFKKEQAGPGDTVALDLAKAGTGPFNDKAKAAVVEKARSIVFKVTLPEFHDAPKAKDDALRPRDPNKSVDTIAREARNEFIKDGEKLPEWKTLKESQREFFREYGAALYDAVLLVMTDKNPPPFLRLNAARLLVTAAETGSPAVGLGLTKLLAGGVFPDPKKAGNPAATPPEVLYYALRACETFLDRYDVPLPGAKDLQPDQLGELVAQLIGMVEKNPPILDKIASSASADLDPTARAAANEVARVSAIQYYRLQAIRALGRARAEGYTRGNAPLRPVYTLAKVALRDPSIAPAPNFKELGEASIGLMAMALAPDVNADVVAYAAASAANEFFRPRAEKSDASKAVDWKPAGLRFSAAAAAWSAATTKNPQVSDAGKKAVGDAAALLERSLFVAVVKPETVIGGLPKVGDVESWLSGVRGGLPDAVIADPRDKNKYKLVLPK